MNLAISSSAAVLFIILLVYVFFSKKYPFSSIRVHSLTHPAGVVAFAALGALSLCQLSVASSDTSQLLITIPYIMIVLCLLNLTYAYLHICKFVITHLKSKNEE